MAVLVTAFLLPLVVGTAWKCWCLPPVPAIRIWAWLFRGTTLTMLAQMWRAEMWKIGPLGRVRTYRDCDQNKTVAVPEIPPVDSPQSADKVAIALKGKGARHIDAAQK